MRALALRSHGSNVVEENDPALQAKPDLVLVRVYYSGICSFDLTHSSAAAPTIIPFLCPRVAVFPVPLWSAMRLRWIRHRLVSPR